ncbi:Lipid A biosynthesis acyltransferase [uncultured delta proteobacterium]|uniref:Lipid A biosynthesis acyltransferase n=1 Tax=uncultured delta proteobacterium TaxID=34034 RepID=A0A212JFK3_9DELT|nr:Lipid A biosynthesis acyltransferase [uncultured delta proteobacterium]
MTRWTGRSMGKRWQHAFFYRLIALGGRRAAYAFLVFVVLAYMFKPSAAMRSEPYLARRFPEARGLARWLHRWRLQWALGKVLVDRAAAGITGAFDIRMAEEGTAFIRSLHAEGRGLILLASHVGCWHISMSALPDLLSVPASVVVFRNSGDYDRHYFEHQGEKPPFELIDIAGGPKTAIAMIQRLQGGGLLCLMGDRPFGDSRVCRVPFLGGEIEVPYTAYHLASVSGAPIVVFFAYRTGPGKGCHTLGGVIRVPEGLGKKPEAYAPYAGMYAAMLERSVAEEPYQFFNFYNMWDTDGHQNQTETRAD